MKGRMCSIVFVALVVLVPSVRAAESAASGPNGWMVSTGVSYYQFDPNLPNDLNMHNTHPDDKSFLEGSAGVTELDTVKATFLDLSAKRIWGIVKGTESGWQWGLDYVLKIPVGQSGRAEKQNENDYRPATEGSFIYTSITDLQPAHEVGVSLHYWWVAGDELFCTLIPSLHIGYWQMSFEKGWDRFGKDEAEQSSGAKGVSISPQLGMSIGTREFKFAITGAYRFIDLKYDTSVLGSSTANGWDIGANVGWQF